jgi:hypothetical protein
MIEIVIWLVALFIAAIAGALALMALWSRAFASRAVVAVSSALILLCCLFGADLLVRLTGVGSAVVSFGAFDKGWVLLANCGIVALTLVAVALLVGGYRWLMKRHPQPLNRLGLVALLVCQIVFASWAGWRFHQSIVAITGVPLESDIEMIQIPGEALLTDKGRLVPVYRARVPEGLEEFASSPDALRSRRIELATNDAQANCHGWVFTGGKYLLKGAGADTILADNDYAVVANPKPGDVIVYRDLLGQIVHTGLVKSANASDGFVLIESKWGVKGRFLHLPEDQIYSQKFAYYRRAHSARLAGSPAEHLVQAVRVLPGNQVLSKSSGEALVGYNRKGDPAVFDALGQPLPMMDSYPMGAE